ncbi:MAG: DUF4926 domain-containing protein [Armatimonadetes bacterium CG_4_10_14_3_um_filter_66_18]|nr:DUF4926 domain-containing protein [Armatimonadota bacterium]OIO94282.1 MAG: hypothetical protein AUJ96_28950 [Armatimonadetes bacterium CG2_30_66_41]PIU93213.1 MAG: DUF4926 domain-containing protein [Armatimonadetes bacterium CG06_land_8_20_14_3_00_66_21]PIW20470.1 MAG: DUF4926 domain-containing protein [Armatimonadetes bacterium CG17_big_fil_post_rev_8_21_14_2_50_66_6]PIY36554.1 MAG: DUF4926 domain-containing protein [Armatimonadetes bacterium CG_4_10_14_3_um_filter_66_18]PIZ35306.1 MAG: D
MPDLFDVVELTHDVPERGLRSGERGTVVERYSEEAYEVEFANEKGETVDLLALRPDQFIVVWLARTRTWVPLPEQVAQLVASLAEPAGSEVLDFARSLLLRDRARYRRAHQPVGTEPQ